jgi:hypothetical protein
MGAVEFSPSRHAPFFYAAMAFNVGIFFLSGFRRGGTILGNADWRSLCFRRRGFACFVWVSANQKMKRYQVRSERIGKGMSVPKG